MSRLLYEVAVLSDRTRNQGIQWNIEPICTSINCRIHPPSLFNVFTCVDRAELNLCRDSKTLENSIQKMCPSSGQSKNFIIHDVFETAQTISGYSSGSQSTQFSECVISESSSNEWLKNSYIVNDETSGAYSEENVEWSDGNSDEFIPFDQGIETVILEAPKSLRSNDQEKISNDGDLSRKAKDKDIGIEKENEESKDPITKVRSFRDALLGFDVLNGPSSTEEKNSMSNLETSIESLKGKPSMNNPPMSLSVPESEDACTGLRPHFVNKMVKLVEPGDEEPVVCLFPDQNENIDIGKNGNGGLNLMSRNEQKAQNDQKSPKVCRCEESFKPYHAQKNDKNTKIGSYKDIYSTMVKYGHYKTKVEDSKSEISSTPTGNISQGKLTSPRRITPPRENEGLDSLLLAGKGKSKNKKKRQKLAAVFTPPTYQNELLNNDILNRASKTPSPTTQSEDDMNSSRSPPSIWKINENIEFDTDTKEFPSLQQKQNRNHKQDNLNNSLAKNHDHLEVFTDSGLGSTRLEETSHSLRRENYESSIIQVQNEAMSVEEQSEAVSTEIQSEAMSTEVQSESTSAKVHTEAPSIESTSNSRWSELSNLTQNNNKRLTLQGPPYKCNIRHETDFRMLRIFLLDWIHAMPGLLQTPENLKTILSISQRIVRIAVRKPYKPIDVKMAEKYQQMENIDLYKDRLMTCHYGTGFCFYIDQQKMYIRTHSHIVGSPQDARSTFVQFNINDLKCNGEVIVECMGLAYDFEKDNHSLTSIFTCATPPELISYLHLFKAVPIIQRTSVFENDTSDVTDSSTESSSTGFEENSSDQMGKISQTHEIWEASNNQEMLNNINNARNQAHTQNLSSLKMLQDVFQIDSNKTLLPQETEIKADEEAIENTKPIWGGFLEDYTTFAYIKPPPQELENISMESELNIPVYHDFDKNDFKTVLPIKGINNFYDSFNSYSADVIDFAMYKPRHYHNVSPFIEPSSIWDYASLIYAQHDHKESYNQAFTPNILKHFDSRGKPCGTETKRELFNLNLNPGDASDSYDYNLLHIEKSSGTVLPNDSELERIVNDLVSEKTNKSPIKPQESNSAFETCINTALIISYPHGGAKMVSTGSISSNHYGGELYDIPTCVGCCGAPLLAFTEDRKIYLTDIVHSGTAKVNNKIQQFGLSCYYGNAYSFAQKMVYSY